MYFLALACDYDGTIAHDGAVDDATYNALRNLKESGRRLLLVTGRELPDLKKAFPGYQLFDRIVAENGAVLYEPATKRVETLAPPADSRLVAALRDKGVRPLSSGHCIVSTWEPHEKTVLEAIRDLGLELEIIFNKGAVMVLPAGINKASGLIEALRSLGLSPHNAVGVGDAENDHAFLRCCGCAAAVANALPSLKEAANAVMKGERGEGVIELTGRLCRDETGLIPPERHAIPVGKDGRGNQFSIEPQKGCVLIAGSSGIGKSTLATALTEKMSAKKFEFCVFDPEGDYLELENAVPAGSPRIPPNVDEVMKLLSKLGANTVVNTQAMEIGERPRFFAALFPQIESARARSGRPHWLLIDEAHHLLPASRGGMEQVLPEKLDATVFITVHPDALAPEALYMVKTVIALGPPAKEVIETFCKTIGISPPRELPEPTEDEVLFYTAHGEAFAINPERPEQKHRRHVRKYAVGDLGPDRSFYFRGPDNALNLRAQNLMTFLQIAEGVDDRTWEFHRKRGDYSKWFRNAIKNGELADEVEKIEQDAQLDPKESRERIKSAVLRRYTAPAQSDAA